MHDHEKIPGLLQLFAQDQGAGVTAADAAQQPGVTAPETGAQASDAGMPETAQTPDADFEALIKDRYKEQFDKRVQEIIRKRLGESNREAGDAAEQVQRGLSAAADLRGDWERQEAAVRELYPAFSMAQALQDPRFPRLLMGGVDLRTAYEVLHNHEILPAAMEYAARTAEAALAKKIAAGGARPGENAVSVRAAAVGVGDVSKFSKADIDDIARRVARGERITFG